MVDLGVMTLRHFKRLEFVQIATDLTDYEIYPQFIKKNADTLTGGDGIKFFVLTGDNGSARQTKLFDSETAGQVDRMVEGFTPWRHTKASWMYERRQVLMNKGSANQVLNFLQNQRIQGHLSLLDHVEDQGWASPTDSNDKLNIWGVPYWIVKNDTEGFNGGAPTGWTTVGDISPTTYTKHKNYTASYTAMSKTDGIAKIKRAMRKTGFKLPTDMKFGGVRENAPQRRLYCNLDTIEAVELAAEAQNNQLGNDLATTADRTTIFRDAFRYVPKLDADADDPVYGIDWDSFKVKVLEGDNLVESTPMVSPDDHNVYVVWIDLTWNMCCDLRRKNFVISK